MGTWVAIAVGIALGGFLKGFFGAAWRDRQFVREVWRERHAILRSLYQR